MRHFSWLAIESRRFLNVHILLLCAMFPGPVAEAQSAKSGCRPPTGAKAQITVNPNYTFAFFRVDELGRPQHCDEVTKVIEATASPKGRPAPLVLVYVHVGSIPLTLVTPMWSRSDAFWMILPPHRRVSTAPQAVASWVSMSDGRAHRVPGFWERRPLRSGKRKAEQMT